MNWRYGALLVGAVLVAGCGGAVRAGETARILVACPVP